MRVKLSDAEINELLAIANASTPAACCWLTDALAAAQAIAEHKRNRQPPAAQRTASLEKIERFVDLLIVGLTGLKRQLSNHEKFWGTAAFCPASALKLEDAPVISALENIP